MTDIQQLAIKLLDIQHMDDKQFYDRRAIHIYEAMALAKSVGIDAGIRFDPKEPEWPVAFIELPTGQIGYHLEQHNMEWDNHTTPEKQVRMLKFVAETLRKDP